MLLLNPDAQMDRVDRRRPPGTHVFPFTDQDDKTSHWLSLSSIHSGERIPVPMGEKEEEEQNEEVDQEEDHFGELLVER